MNNPYLPNLIEYNVTNGLGYEKTNDFQSLGFMNLLEDLINDIVSPVSDSYGANLDLISKEDLDELNDIEKERVLSQLRSYDARLKLQNARRILYVRTENIFQKLEELYAMCEPTNP